MSTKRGPIKKTILNFKSLKCVLSVPLLQVIELHLLFVTIWEI